MGRVLINSSGVNRDGRCPFHPQKRRRADTAKARDAPVTDAGRPWALFVFSRLFKRADADCGDEPHQQYPGEGDC